MGSTCYAARKIYDALTRDAVGAGRTNFETAYCLATQKISAKCDVPLLYRLAHEDRKETIVRRAPCATQLDRSRVIDGRVGYDRTRRRS